MYIKSKNIPNKLSNKKVFYDPSFQRPECWPVSTRNAYFQSLLRGWAKHAITLADAEACLEHAISSHDVASQEYYSDVLSRGYKFISIDGSHRTKNLIRFLANEITVSGSLLDADGNFHDLKNVFYKDLVKDYPRVADRLRDTDMTLHVYNDLSRTHLPELFRAINEGFALNAQHVRQSLDTPVAPWVRNLARSYAPMMERVFPDFKRKQMLDHEFLAKLAMSLMRRYNVGISCGWKAQKAHQGIHHWNLKPADIDKWYAIGQGHYNFDDSVCIYNSAEIARVEKILQIISAVICQQSKYTTSSRKIPFKTVWAVTAASEWLHDNHYSIDNYEKFFEKIVELDSRLAVKSEDAYSQKRKLAIKKRQDPETISDRPYYFNWLRYANDASSRQNRATQLINEIRKDVGAYHLRKKQSAPIAAK